MTELVCNGTHHVSADGLQGRALATGGDTQGSEEEEEEEEGRKGEEDGRGGGEEKAFRNILDQKYAMFCKALSACHATYVCMCVQMRVCMCVCVCVCVIPCRLS